MHETLYTIEDVNAGRRLETVLCALLPQVARGRLMKWLRCGKVRLNQKRARPHIRLAAGDVLRLPFVQPCEPHLPAAAPARRRSLPPLDVVYEDADVLVACKPAELASHPGMGHADDSLSARLVQHLSAYDAPVGLRPGLAQRLDRGVTGLVPCGKHAAALRGLANQPLVKSYVAWVFGSLAADAGSITHPLLVCDEPRGNRPKVVVDAVHGKSARTDFLVLARRRRATLVRLLLHTGRTHQIRAHMRALGHPLLGDPRYADAQDNAWVYVTYGIKRPLLHAARLSFVHPITAQRIVARAPLPHDFAMLVRAP